MIIRPLRLNASHRHVRETAQHAMLERAEIRLAMRALYGSRRINVILKTIRKDYDGRSMRLAIRQGMSSATRLHMRHGDG